MVARVEPPRWRPGLSEPERYPGLTAEERGYDPPSTPRDPPELAPPLWVAPSALPPPSRSVGLVMAPPAPLAAPRLEPEGLFDVPGLLERLWLARALEARREPPGEPSATASRPTGSVSPHLPTPPGALDPARPVTAPTAREGPPRAVPGDYGAQPLVPPRESVAEPSPSPPPSWPSSWICPYCYLANDPRAATCRGCRSSSLHL